METILPPSSQSPPSVLTITHIQEKIWEVLGEGKNLELESLYFEVSSILAGLNKEKRTIDQWFESYLKSDEVLKEVQEKLTYQYTQIKIFLDTLKMIDPSQTLYKHFYEHTLYDVVTETLPLTPPTSPLILDNKDIDILRKTGIGAKFSELIWNRRKHLLASIQNAQKVVFYCDNLQTLSPELLKEISFHATHITAIYGKCKILELDGEQRSHLFGNIGSLKHISLDLFDWEHSMPDVESLLNPLTQLRSLSISKIGNLSHSPKRLKILSQYQTNNLRVLRLNSASLWKFQSSEISSFFSQMENLRIFDLHGFDLTETPIENIKVIFSPLKKLEFLSLLQCRISENSGEKLKIIFCSLPNLKILGVSTSTLEKIKALIGNNFLPNSCQIIHTMIGE